MPMKNYPQFDKKIFPDCEDVKLKFKEYSKSDRLFDRQQNTNPNDKLAQRIIPSIFSSMSTL